MSAKRRIWRIGIAIAAMVASITAVVLAIPGTAQAAPGCQDGGVYVLWVRGSGQGFGAVEANTFGNSLFTALHAAGITSYTWAELGNLNEDFDPPNNLDPGEYPAVAAGWSNLTGAYTDSVVKGAIELINHLNYRYLGPSGCMSETVVLGGYSQGADVLRWVLAQTNGAPLFGYPMPALTPEARNHIGFAALYGEPHFNVGCGQDRPWFRGNARCASFPLLGAVNPYVPSDVLTRTGSWCDDGDGICAYNANTSLPYGNHTTVYRNHWIQQSASEIAAAARLKQCSLILACSAGGVSAPAPPPAAGNPFGSLDEAGLTPDGTKTFVRGWTIDPNTANPIAVHIYIDGAYAGAATANTSRPDVGAAFPGYGNNHGYYAEIPIGIGTHDVCVYAINTGAGDANPQLPYCKTVARTRFMALNGNGALYSRDLLTGGGWTQQNGPSDTLKFLVSTTGRMMLRTSCGAVYAKDDPGAGWTPQLSCGDSQDLAIGAGRMMVTNGNGVLFAKDTLTGGWVQQNGAGDTLTFAVGSNGSMMIRSSCGAAFGKASLTDNWTQLLTCGDSQDVAVS